ncbi:MAG TPA: hypothetical protein VMR45_02970 [Patescibacteria group bacterium]|nr:hypothetical protein [Patescibacteria group bacterium]
MRSNHTYQWLRSKLLRNGKLPKLDISLLVVSFAALLVLLLPSQARAAISNTDFNVQVSPSPMVVTLKPGKQQTSTLTVRNLSNHSETLYPRVNSFTVSKNSKNVQLEENAPANVKDWVSLQSSALTIAAGGSQNLTVQYNTPADAGFSYTMAITLARQSQQPGNDNLKLRGSVAVFCLINIDRPDAKRQLEIASLSSNKGHYQYLPASFTLTVNNTGNTIDQPKGTLFIQRSFNDTKPLATIALNPGSHYILPNTSREFTAEWNNGFPVYVKKDNGKSSLSWDWKHLSDLRFGRYVAKAVMVYNDGQHDIPVVAARTFWVIPWTFIFIATILGVILVTGLLGWGKLIFKGTKRVRKYAARHK